VLLRMSDMPNFERVNFHKKHKDGPIYLAPRFVAEKVPLKQPELQLA